MPVDILIPFAILTMITVYLIYSRNSFEKKMLQDYEEKYEEWKRHASTEKEKKGCKRLVGLVFEEDLKIEIECLDKNVEDRLERGKFQILKDM